MLVNLSKLPTEKLLELGFKVWDDKHPEATLYLAPAYLYDCIVDGQEVVDINYTKEVFVHGTTDDDRRAGVLAFGILVRKV
jgi:hypothetical protein